MKTCRGFLLSLLLAGVALTLGADETRTLRVRQDDGQTRFTTKLYLDRCLVTAEGVLETAQPGGLGLAGLLLNQLAVAEGVRVGVDVGRQP